MTGALLIIAGLMIIYQTCQKAKFQKKIEDLEWDVEEKDADAKLYKGMWVSNVQRMNEENQKIFDELNKRLVEQEEYITLLEQENFDAQVNWKEVACSVYANSFVASEDLEELDEDTQDSLERAYNCYLAERE
jgi:hypothetical protein